MPAALLPAMRSEEAAWSDRLARLRATFARGQMPRVAQALPTITPGGTIAGATHSISPSDPGCFRYSGGAPYKLSFAGTDWVKLRTVSYSADESDIGMIGGSVEFVTNAPKVIVELIAESAPIRLWIDGALLIAPPAVLTYDNAAAPLIDFAPLGAGPIARRVRIDVGAGGVAPAFAGVTIPVGYDVWAPGEARPRCVVAGDSFTEGVTADGTPAQIAGLSGYVNHLGWWLGFDDCWCSGSGGTGWQKTNGARVALVDRFDRDVIAPAPDLAVIAMGVNDGDVSAVHTAATACVRRFRAALPTSPLVLVAPWAPQGARVAGMHEAIAGATATDRSNRTVFIATAMAGHEWQWPAAGNAGAPTGLGNGDWMVDVLGTHPTVAGHAYLGARLAGAIAAAVGALA